MGTIKANWLKGELSQALRAKSGLEGRRAYLGMSGIGNCSRKLYFEFVQGKAEASDQAHWYCWTGYLHEAAVLGLIVPEQNKGELRRQVEVVAGFDNRFRGHVDFAFEQQVIEIKSVGWDKFKKIREAGRPQYEHRCQVQMYLRHGGWRQGLVVYIARDVPHNEFDGLPFWVFEVEPDETLANTLDAKARMILTAIDRREAPECSCGWCRV